MQNPQVSLTSVGPREVRYRNTRPTTGTARFFSYTYFGNWTDQGRLIEMAVVTVADGRWLYSRRYWLIRGCSRWSPTANQWFFWRYSNVRHAINKRRASPGSWSQELSSHTKVNEIRQRRPKWRQFKKWSFLLVCTIARESRTYMCESVVCEHMPKTATAINLKKGI